MKRFLRLGTAACLGLALALPPIDSAAASGLNSADAGSVEFQIARGGGGRGGGGSRGGGGGGRSSGGGRSGGSSGRTGFSTYSGGGSSFRGSQKPSGGWSSGSSRASSPRSTSTGSSRSVSGQGQRQTNAGARQSDRSTTQADRRDASTSRQQGRQDNAGGRQDQRTDRTDTRQSSRTDRSTDRQDNRSDRVSDRTDLRGDRADNRWDNTWSGWARPGWGAARPWAYGWYGGWSSPPWGWWGARSVAWGVGALATTAAITSLVDDAIDNQVTYIEVPETSYELYYPSVEPVGTDSITFAANSGSNLVEFTADCKQGTLNGRTPETAEEAQLLNAACQVAYGD